MESANRGVVPVLDERKRRVLQAIIDDYIDTASPVGSRTIARKYNLGVSPATIRNEMADLEELGYLEQPHTSAGRIPSDKGYRFYVDTLMDIRYLAEEEGRRIRQLYRQRVREIGWLIQQTTRVLAETTNYLALIRGPQVGRAAFRYFHLVPLFPGRALLVAVTETGLTETRVMELPGGITAEELAEVSSLINRSLDQSFEKVKQKVVRQLRGELSRYRAAAQRALELLTEVMAFGEDEEHVYLGGTAHILNEPEFRDLDRVRRVFGVLEQARLVRRLLSIPVLEGGPVAIRIGEEIEIEDMQDCSLVSAPYTVAGRFAGRIGVVGPKRMHYSRVVAVVREVARSLSEVLDETLG